MKITQVTITPALAQRLLGENTKNRPLNSRHVNRLAASMRKGEWKANGDTFVRDKGVLVDGQHRLQAVVLSGIPIPGILVEDTDEGAFLTKDSGKPRSAGDALAILGEVDTNLLAAALTRVHTFKQGVLFNKGRFTTTEVAQFISLYPTMPQSLSAGKKFRIEGSAGASWWVAAHYLFAEKDPDAASDFLSSVGNGIGLQKTDPAYLLRERALKQATSKSKIHPEHLFILMIKAWNAFRSGKKMSCLKFASDEESIPQIA